MNINISTSLFKDMLNGSDTYRSIMYYIIDCIEHQIVTVPRGIKQINRKHLINNLKLPKEEVYKTLSYLVDKDILRRFSNDIYDILQDNITENLENSIRTISKKNINNIIDTSVKYVGYNTSCKILYIHYINILDYKIPAITYQIEENDEVITTSVIEFIKKYSKLKTNKHIEDFY